MSPLIAALALAAGIDGEAALRHASALSSLGPHPWGSPRSRVAAEYVAAQFREAGLDEVRLQPFEQGGLRGTNVLGVLRAPGPEFVLVGAHHDSAPDAPGAYDDGSGVGVLIEAARVLARDPSRRRTFVFASFDGEEAWSTGKTTTAGSRAYIAALGPQARDLTAAFVIEMCGWAGGRPVLHPIPYTDPLRPGASVVTPAWLARAVQDGAREAGEPLPVGDPLVSWLYQPAVRIFRVGLYGDDLSFAQAHLPAVFVADSSFSRYYPWYHTPGDTRDKLDARALERMGRAALGALRAVQDAPRDAAPEPHWFSAFGQVWGAPVLYALAGLSLVPGLVRLRARGTALVLRGAQAALFAFLTWRHPTATVCLFVLPNLLTGLSGARWTLVGLLPALAVFALGAAAWQRDMVRGLWLLPWELALGGLALALLWLQPGAGPRAASSRSRSASPPARGKAGLPKKRR
jgi:hypothetical protein